ncbi:hypothetical protein Syun_010547 [Stephania yunnanensis]|uniref:Uncharacterized protein n=1 Tax=Stephania yunnanensis TaxID=152371 RepID=A0AAP0KI92_9MAGN
MQVVRRRRLPTPSKYDYDMVLKDKSDMTEEKNLDQMTYTLVDGKWVSNLLLNEPSTPVTKGKNINTNKKVVEQYSQSESDKEEETPVHGEETTDDVEDMEEENSNYVDDEDAAVDEGLTEQVPRDPYDSQDDMKVDSGGKAASLAHDDDDVGHDFIAESVTVDKGNDKGKDPANEKVKDLDIRVMFGNMGNVFNSTIASLEDRFSKDLFHNYRMMDDRVRGIEENIVDHGSVLQRALTQMTTQIRMRHDQ